MKTNDVFPSKYLKAEDDLFDNGEVVATIKDVQLESLKSRERGEESKPVMYFKELPKGLIVNKTNWGICAKLFSSDDSDDWTGERVALIKVDVDAFGDVVQAIRVKSQKPTVNKQDVLDGYSKIFARAKELKVVENIELYAVTPNMDTQEILDLGKELRSKINATELFA
jgi:hypothetical protein